MSIQKIVDTFFDEHFYAATKYYLYKDKQLLKDERYQEFADRQIRKAKRILAMIPGILLFAYFSAKSFIQYGSTSDLFGLILGIFSFICFTAIVVLSTKEYYTITSSMNLFKKLLAQMDQKSPEK